MSKPVAIVLVSHSRLIAEGTKELAQTMAPEVHIAAVGGDPDGGLGSSYDLIESVIKEAMIASGGSGVVVLTDIGSTTLTVDSVIEFSDIVGPVRLALGPLVEGAIAAAVRASQGADEEAVVEAVADAARSLLSEVETSGSSDDGSNANPTGSSDDLAQVEVTVGDPSGLHARPAAMLARQAAGYDAKIHVNGALATSVVDVMARGISYGDRVTVRVQGPNAQAIASTIGAAISAGFDES